MKKKRKVGIGRDFMRKTQFKLMDPTDQSQNQPGPPGFYPPHPALPVIDLPDPQTVTLEEVSLRKAIEDRKSEREFLVDKSITLDALSYLLWSTQGVKEADQMDTFKTVPSAGARHPLETFLLIQRVDSLDTGLYRYIGPSHQLQNLQAGDDIVAAISATSLQPELIQNSLATFIWTAVAYRTTWRYGDRGYRYIHLEAGHVGQNLYLASQMVGCGVCTTAAFNDDDLNRALGIDGNDRFAVYMGAIGK
jgi:SagB-type dehydrogenase family enzyme